MSKYFNANFNIIFSEEITPGEYYVYGQIGDFSADGWSVLDVKVGNAFIDGAVCRWRLTEITAIHEASYPGADFSSIKIKCVWDDNGVQPVGQWPAAGTGYISEVSGAMRSMYAAPASAQFTSDDMFAKTLGINNFAFIDKFMQKSVKNGTLETLLKNRVAAWQDNGTVCYANASVHSVSDIAGLLLEDIAPDSFGQIQKTGYIPDALIGLSAVPGAAVFLSDVDGTMSLIPPTGATDSIIKMGRAEPPSGVATATANDLHMEIEYISEP
jgi:hypothetical protein